MSPDPYDAMSIPSLIAAAVLVGMCAALVFGVL
jgi:hypothetical protein